MPDVYNGTLRARPAPSPSRTPSGRPRPSSPGRGRPPPSVRGRLVPAPEYKQTPNALRIGSKIFSRLLGAGAVILTPTRLGDGSRPSHVWDTPAIPVDVPMMGFGKPVTVHVPRDTPSREIRALQRGHFEPMRLPGMAPGVHSPELHSPETLNIEGLTRFNNQIRQQTRRKREVFLSSVLPDFTPTIWVGTTPPAPVAPQYLPILPTRPPLLHDFQHYGIVGYQVWPSGTVPRYGWITDNLGYQSALQRYWADVHRNAQIEASNRNAAQRYQNELEKHRQLEAERAARQDAYNREQAEFQNVQLRIKRANRFANFEFFPEPTLQTNKEHARRRQRDRKTNSARYRYFLAKINRTYGRADEAFEIALAFNQNLSYRGGDRFHGTFAQGVEGYLAGNLELNLLGFVADFAQKDYR